jgi:hypothetical protein
MYKNVAELPRQNLPFVSLLTSEYIHQKVPDIERDAKGIIA